MTYGQFLRLDWLLLGDIDVLLRITERLMKMSIKGDDKVFEYDSDTLLQKFMKQYENKGFVFHFINNVLYLDVNKSNDYTMSNYNGFEVELFDMKNYSKPTLFIKTCSD